MKLSTKFLNELYSDKGVRVIFLSNAVDNEPFGDGVVRALLAVDIGSHKATLNTLLNVYGFQDAFSVIQKAEKNCQELYIKRLKAKGIDVESLDSHEICQTYFNHFGATDYNTIIEDSYAQCYREFFGIKLNLVDDKRKVSCIAIIEDKTNLSNLLAAATTINQRELQYLRKHIKSCATHSNTHLPDLSTFKHSNYLASLPFDKEEASSLAPESIDDSQLDTEGLTTTQKKIRKFLKNHFRETFARNAAQERGYDIKTPKQWAGEQDATYESQFMTRGMFIRYSSLLAIDNGDAETIKRNQFNQTIETMMSQFYYSKIHTANACNFEIYDGIAAKSANWGFLYSAGYSHNLNVLATASDLGSALSFSKLDSTPGFSVLQIYAVTESIYTGLCTSSGQSPEDEYSLFYEKPHEILASLVYYDSNEFYAIVNPRFINMSTEEICKKLNIKEDIAYKKLLDMALQQAQLRANIKPISAFKSVDNTTSTSTLLQLNYPKGYQTSRAERIYQPRIKWINKHFAHHQDVKQNFDIDHRQASYFDLSSMLHCSFRNISFKHMSFYKASMSDVCFIGCDFTKASWKDVDLRNVRFLNCKLSVHDLLNQAVHVDEKTRNSLSVVKNIGNNEYHDTEEYQAANKIKSAYKFFSHSHSQKEVMSVMRCHSAP
jgi:hypothetical protein